MSRLDLSPMQQKYLAWIVKFISSKGRSPTLAEMGVHFGTTPQNADLHIRAMVRKGYLKALRKGPARSLVVIDDEGQQFRPNQVTVIGRVAAGLPVLAVENRIGVIMLDDIFLRRGATFALEVQGESMVDAGIMPGDKVIIKPQTIADSGQIALALIDDSVTIKRFYPMEDGTIRLHPENRRHKDIIVSAENCQIQGVVIGVYREVD